MAKTFRLSVRSFKDIRVLEAGPCGLAAFVRLCAYYAEWELDTSNMDPHLIRNVITSAAGVEAMLKSKLLVPSKYTAGRYAVCDLYMATRVQVSRALRLSVIERDGYVCQICRQGVDPDDVHVDHIIPVQNGGRTVKENLRVTHSACNLRRPRMEEAAQ